MNKLKKTKSFVKFSMNESLIKDKCWYCNNWGFTKCSCGCGKRLCVTHVQRCENCYKYVCSNCSSIYMIEDKKKKWFEIKQKRFCNECYSENQ